jgi:hypothetical protein
VNTRKKANFRSYIALTLKEYRPEIHTWVLSLRNTTNTNTFLGRPPGLVKFVGPQVSSRIGQSGRVTPDGILWDVTLVFEDSDEGHIITVQDVWVEKGETVAITDLQDSEQLTHYKYYRDEPFESLLAVLEAYA